MKVVLTLIVLVLLCPAQMSRMEDLTLDIAQFHEHWDTFVRAYFGCPKTAVSTEECNPHLSTFDYKAYLASRKAAKKLFSLEEKK